MLSRIIQDGYGSLRGWNRGGIRAEVAAHESMSLEEIQRLAWEGFRNRVREAVGSSPLFAEKVRQHCGMLPDCTRMVDPARLPVWTKDDLRQWYATAPVPPVPGAWVHATGGTSGMPCRFYVTRESYEWRMAVSDRGYRWAGAEEGVRSVYVWGAPAARLSPAVRFRRALINRIQNRWFYNAMVLDAERCEACVDLINRVRPAALVGYAGCLVTLADHVVSHPGCLTHRVRSIITAAEGIDGNQVARLSAALGGMVYQSYGSREFMLIGMECRAHGGYHLSSDNLLVEVVDEAGRPCVEQAGRILVTDLHNAATPFIRYETGDVGVMSAEPCPCGLPFPLLRRVDGRVQDLLTLPGGKQVSALLLPHVMKEHRWVNAYQLEVMEDDPSRWILNVMSDTDVTEAARIALVANMHRWVGETVAINLRHVDRLVRAPNGKTPVVVRERKGRDC